MGSRNVVKMFLRTLFFGGLAGLITSFFIKADQYRQYLSPFDFKELAGVILFFLGLGFVFSVVSQTGFFAYLFIHRFGLNLFRSYWSPVQIVLIAFVLFDLVYFPYIGSDDGSSLHTHVLIAAGILLFGLIIATIKAKETNKGAFIPALFLMVVMTTLEWVPGLRTDGSAYKWLMIIPLLVSNAYQILMLHRMQEPEKIKASEERRRKRAEKKEQLEKAKDNEKNTGTNGKREKGAKADRKKKNRKNPSEKS